MKLLRLLIALNLLFGIVASGAMYFAIDAMESKPVTVKLAWDPSLDDPRVNPNGFVTGYRLHWNGGQIDTTNLTVTVSNLPSGKYSFTVTALATNYDGSPLESDPSNEVSTNVLKVRRTVGAMYIVRPTKHNDLSCGGQDDSAAISNCIAWASSHQWK